MSEEICPECGHQLPNISREANQVSCTSCGATLQVSFTPSKSKIVLMIICLSVVVAVLSFVVAQALGMGDDSKTLAAGAAAGASGALAASLARSKKAKIVKADD